MAEPPTDGLIVRIDRRPAHAGHGETPADSTPGKRAAIVREATSLFLDQGYHATSTEQIATAAAVSKQTVYNQFGDKQSLFHDIVLGVTATAEAFAVDLFHELGQVGAGDDVEPALRSLARRYLATVIDPQVLALRRLLIGEATRFPDLAATYYDRAPARVLAALAAQLGRMADRGWLRLGDPDRAAADFAFLLLGRPLDEGMFRLPDPDQRPLDVAALADHAVDVFLAAYPPTTGS